MALLAGKGINGFFLGRSVPGVAFVAGIVLVAIPLLASSFFCSSVLIPML